MQMFWMGLAIINVVMSLVFEFKNDVHNANNAMLWVIWTMLLSFYFKEEGRK